MRLCVPTTRCEFVGRYRRLCGPTTRCEFVGRYRCGAALWAHHPVRVCGPVPLRCGLVGPPPGASLWAGPTRCELAGTVAVRPCGPVPLRCGLVGPPPGASLWPGPTFSGSSI